jgi:hypothetical protein
VRSITLAVALVAALIALGWSLSAAAVDARGERGIDIHTFMTGLACTESGGRFEALNSRTRAYGKYQIMPGNWRAWAKRYLGNRWAEPTPRNQEFVARMRIQDLYDKHGSWRSVASWWLTGNVHDDEALIKPGTLRYIEKVMGTARTAATPTVRETVRQRCFPVAYRDPKVRTEPWPRIEITGRRVTIRSGAGAENRILDYVRRDARLPVLAKGEDPRGRPWLKVGLAKSRTGWIAAWFTRAVDR